MPMMFFYFLKIIFDISTSKQSKKYKPHSILAKKKKFKFERNTGTNAIPNVTKMKGHHTLKSRINIIYLEEHLFLSFVSASSCEILQ